MQSPYARPSEARRLTDMLRAGSQQGIEYRHKGTVNEQEGTLQLVLQIAVLRQRILADGTQHTTAVYHRDDVINLCCYLGSGCGRQTSDYLIALKGTVVGSVPDAAVAGMRALAPAGHDGISVLIFRELGISQERTINLAVRSSAEAMAHFFCETLTRCAADEVKPERRCRLSLTQEMLASILGMSAVHVNRTLRNLRNQGLVDMADHQLIIRDFARLSKLATFTSGYLTPI